MATKIGSLFYEIYADSSKLNKGLSESKSGVKKLSDGFKSLTGISLSAAGAITAVAAGLKFAINEAIEAEVSETKLNTVLESTGYAAGMTKDALMEMATSLSKVTMYSEETIMDAESLLLTFTKIGKDTFPEATEAALNMSAAFGQDLQSSVIQLGKALNDPTGMAAMKRIGVSFSDAQIQMAKAMFEAGDVAGYQKLILQELNREVGGMAKAMGGTYAGQVAIFKNALGELGETVGKQVMPGLVDLITILNALLDGNVENAIEVYRLQKAQDNITAAFNRGDISLVEYNRKMSVTNGLLSELTGQIFVTSTALEDNIEDWRLESMGIEAARKAAQGFTPEIEGAGNMAAEQSKNIWHFSNGVWSLVGGLAAIPGQYDAYVTVHYSFEGTDSRDSAEWATPGAGADWMGGNWNPWDSYNWDTGTGGAGGATGLSMRVPPGYPGDSFIIGATSGETVEIGRTGDRDSGRDTFDYDRLARLNAKYFAQELQKVSR